MAVSEAQKRAKAKWNKANLTILACNVYKSKAEEFKAACKAAGTTPNAVLYEAVENFIKEHPINEDAPE